MILEFCSEDLIDTKFRDSKEGVTWRQPFGRMLKINLKMDYEAILKIKFVDQLWTSNTSEISLEYQNPRYHLEDLDWRSISVTLDICSEDPIDGQTLIFQSRFFWRSIWRLIMEINCEEQSKRAIEKSIF